MTVLVKMGTWLSCFTDFFFQTLFGSFYAFLFLASVYLFEFLFLPAFDRKGRGESLLN